MVTTEPNSKRHGAVARLANAYWHSGAALITTAAFLFSCTSLAVKLIGDDIPTFQVVLVPGLICFAATSLVVQSYGLSVRSKSWRVAGLTLLRGILGATSITCFYLAIELLPLQDAVTLFFCSPVLASLFELAVTEESSGWAGAAATACTVVGVVLVSQPDCFFRRPAGLLGGGLHSLQPAGSVVADSYGRHLLHWAHGSHGGIVAGLRTHDNGGADISGGGDGGNGVGINPLGAVLATAAAAANAAAFVVVRLLRRCQSTVVLTWWYHAVVVAVSSVPLALRYPSAAVLPSRRGAALLGAVCATQFGGQLLLNRGFQLESATRGSAINVLQVLFCFMWDVAVLGDTPGLVSVAGSSLVAAGVLCVALTGRKPSPEPHHGLSDRPSHDGICAAADDAVSERDDAEAGSAGRRSGGAAPHGHGWVGRAGGEGGRSGGVSGRSSYSGTKADGEAGLEGLPSRGDGGTGLHQPLLLRVVGRLSLDTAT